jgi:hypothetical protein
MTRSNWPIKSLIKSLDLTFKQICSIIISFDFESKLSFNLGYNWASNSVQNQSLVPPCVCNIFQFAIAKYFLFSFIYFFKEKR